MTIVLSLLLAVTASMLVLASIGYLAARKSLHRFQGIADAERYRSECKLQATQALEEINRLATLKQTNQNQILQQQNQIRQYFSALGKLKSVAELDARLKADSLKAQQLSVLLGNLTKASQLSDFVKRQEAEIGRQKQQLTELTNAFGHVKTVNDIIAQVKYYENYLAQLKTDIESVEEAGVMQQFGFYRARYEFANSEGYKDRLESVRAKQKEMLKKKTACKCSLDWHVDGDRKKGQKMVDQQVSLMLRAFNGETDAAVTKVKYNNVVALEKRIQKSFESINKLGQTQQSFLSEDYLKLKIEELHLAHEYHEKKQEEKEFQAEERERIREEERALKEIEEAQEQAEREEELKAKALETARQQLAADTGRQTEKLAALVSKLELELKDAIDRKAKAIARAQLTRSGHVYILSNIGTFGEDVYKIGLTRRLEPLERVKELGNAAVPFPFDVHAMIYCEDAPALENTLHKHFADRRVNLVNLRREFFRVSLDEIRAAVAKYHGHVTFTLSPEAEEFRKTEALSRERSIPIRELQPA